MHPLDRDRYIAALDGLLHQRSGRIQHDIRLRGADGHYSWFLLKARPVIGAQGEVVRVIGALSDVTESKEAEERILHDAIHDNLTGLPNRELFFDRLEAALIQARRAGSPRPLVIVIDIDRLQTVNDSMGMSFGDSALLTVARRAARDLKPGDTLARLGGDKFGAIAMIEGDAARASAMGEALRAQLAHPISFGDREVALTASLGVALYEPALHAKGVDLFADADIALANAKKAGGDRAVLFAREMRASRENRGGLENDLRHALQRGEILILFRPDRPIGGSHGRRLRSLAALAASSLGDVGSPRVPAGGRSVGRPDRHRRLGARGDRARTRGVAESSGGHAADLRQPQHLLAPDARTGFARRRQGRAQPP